MQETKQKAPLAADLPDAGRRREGPPRPLGLADFDEQLWPVNLLLFLFAAGVAGIIVAKSDFASPRLLANGWCHLGALAVIVATLAWGIVRLEGRVQHRMQLGVFLSLLVHLGLCTLSYNLHLSAIAQRQKDSPEVIEEPKPVTLPDYHWQNEAMDDATDPTLERPVETSTPDTEDEIERTEPVEEPKQRPAEQEPEVRPQPSVTPIERVESSAPRRGERAGPHISRQQLRLAETSEQAALPQVTDPQSPEHRSLDSAVRIERVETRTLLDRPESETRLSTNGPSAASLVRQPGEERPPVPGSVALARRPTEAAPARRIRAESDRVAETPDSAPRLTPQTGEVQRADTQVALARRNRLVTEPRSLTVESAPRRAEPRSRQPRVDSRADSRLAKNVSPTTTASPSVGTMQPQIQSQPTRFADTRVESIERAATSLPAASMTARASQEVVEAGTGNLGAGPIEAARRLAGEPSFSSTASAATSRRLASAAATEAALAESSPAASAVPSAQPMTQPSTTALSKASGGATGLTRQQNFDSELPGSSSNAVSRSAARRAEATRAIDAGPGAAPSDTARVARARAGAVIPSASLPAEDVAMADVAGSRRPADTQASSSAAVERVAAAAPRGRITAAAGSGMIDQGVPQIRSPIGGGRTSGGGEPSLSRGELQANVARATGAAEVSGSVAGSDARVPAARQTSAAAPSGLAGEQGGAAPSSTSVGHAASAVPGRTVEAANMADGSLTRAAAGKVTRQGAESLPQVADQLAAVRRPRAAPAGAALDAVDGRAEAVAPSAATFSEPATNQSGDGEPASASDLVRQSPGGHPARGDEIGETGVSPAASIGAGLARRHGEESAVAVGNGSGSSPGKSPSPATIGEALAFAEATAVEGSPSGRGMDAARPSDLSGERRSAALPVLAAAPLGSGGLGGDPAFDVGLPSRLARPESEVARLDSGRLIIERSGANRAAEVRVQDVAVPGFRQRDRQLREELARQRGGNEGSEQAVEMGLDFLARHQNVDGSWSLQLQAQKLSPGRGSETAGSGQMVSDTAATGLAMLSFLGAGYTHTDGKYRLVVGRGLNYLLGNQRPDGDLFLPQEAKSNLNVWLYSHGIASIALCEAYGMTRDPNLRQPAQSALDFIVASQHPTDGGWRYSPRQGSDTSVSGWQLMALKSGELAGLQVPAATYAKVTHWLDGAQAKTNQAHYVYRPKAARDHQRTASRVMTAEALLMRQYLGWKRNNRLMTAGADYLLDNLPEWTSDPSRQRDSYYWYYATQVMFQMGGQHWDAWNGQLRPLLVEKQIGEGPLAGSWEPLGDVPDRWGREGGRIYVTAMHLLMLEVYYRHLPLYRTLEGE